MRPVPNDYDDAPQRWASLDRSIQIGGDVHAPVARAITERCVGMVLDVGGGERAATVSRPTRPGCRSAMAQSLR
jgi:hypothetical protein